MEHLNNFEQFESMIHRKSVDQMRKISKILGKNDIGKKVSDDSFANALDSTKRDIMDTKIETFDEYQNEPFEINQNRKKLY